MLAYIIRRLIIAVIVTLGVAAITFVILHYIAPTPAYTVLGTKASSVAVQSWNQLHGYDRPEISQFITYLGNLAHGNLGYSYKLDQTVTALFKENVGRSTYLSGAALVLSLLIAIPLGIAQAVRRNGLMDYSLTGLNFTLYAMPTFLLGLLLIQFLALDAGIFPVGVGSNITTTLGAIDHPRQLFLPIVTLTLTNVASFSRYMRSAALDELAQDYVRLARAKGLSQRAVLLRHLLRNACLPMITLVGVSIPLLLAGNLVVEVLFNYPGLGLMFWTALGNLDYNVLLALTIVGSVLTVIGNLVADVAISIADPRVRLD